MKIAVFFSCHNIYRRVKKNRNVSFFQYRAALLQSIFLKGLNEAVKDCLVGRAGTKSLQKLIALAIKVDNGLRERRRERAQVVYSPDTAASPTAPHWPSEPQTANNNLSVASTRQEEPMQLGQNQLTSAECSRRFKEGLCIYCGQTGHQLATCPQGLNPSLHQLQFQ